MALYEGKKYKMDKSEGFDDYMKALGVGMVLRKMGNQVTPTVEVIKNGDEYTLNTTSTFKSSTITFKDGVEFEEETVDGRKVKSTAVWEGPNKLVVSQKGEKPTTLTRVFTATDMECVMVAGDAKCTRTYKAL